MNPAGVPLDITQAIVLDTQVKFLQRDFSTTRDAVMNLRTLSLLLQRIAGVSSEIGP